MIKAKTGTQTRAEIEIEIETGVETEIEIETEIETETGIETNARKKTKIGGEIRAEVGVVIKKKSGDGPVPAPEIAERKEAQLLSHPKSIPSKEI